MRALTTAILLLALGTGSAWAATSLAQEQQDGRRLAAEVRSGATACRDLSGEDLDHIGEYAMYRVLGSTAAHRAMNERMVATLGEARETRMHEVLGARFVGCPVAGGQAVGPAMMGGAGAMMGGGGDGWMRSGTWRHMSRGQWQAMAHTWLGDAGRHHDASGWAMAAAVLGGLLLVGLVVVALLRWLPPRRPHGPSPA